ncbi:hypothetical protein AYI69_g9775 [Smittium culicis]|uniref:Uncharacterized protein n=1 Tax=Smittium culicis TaxID=133412 RepID=A0A1R1XAD0_9FUNG|nr:hypothetical protein AYI69_g9775 [Smittium culicis]
MAVGGISGVNSVRNGTIRGKNRVVGWTGSYDGGSGSQDECFKRRCYSDYTNTPCVSNCYNVKNPSYDTVVKAFNCYSSCQSKYVVSLGGNGGLVAGGGQNWYSGTTSDADAGYYGGNGDNQDPSKLNYQENGPNNNNYYNNDNNNYNGNGYNTGYVYSTINYGTDYQNGGDWGYPTSTRQTEYSNVPQPTNPSYIETTSATHTTGSYITKTTTSTNYNFFEWYSGFVTLSPTYGSNPFTSNYSDINSVYSTQSSASFGARPNSAQLFAIAVVSVLALAAQLF